MKIGTSAHRKIEFRLINKLLVMLNLKYDPLIHALPVCEKEKVKYIAPVTDSRVKHTKESFVPYLPVFSVHNDKEVEEWIIKPNLKAVDRVSEITQSDEVIIFNDKRIKKEKYLRIKKHWAVGHGLKKASMILTGEFGKGYKETTIRNYYKYYSTALEIRSKDIIAS